MLWKDAGVCQCVCVCLGNKSSLMSELNMLQSVPISLPIAEQIKPNYSCVLWPSPKISQLRIETLREQVAFYGQKEEEDVCLCGRLCALSISVGIQRRFSLPGIIKLFGSSFGAKRFIRGLGKVVALFCTRGTGKSFHFEEDSTGYDYQIRVKNAKRVLNGTDESVILVCGWPRHIMLLHPTGVNLLRFCFHLDTPLRTIRHHFFMLIGFEYPRLYTEAVRRAACATPRSMQLARLLFICSVFLSFFAFIFFEFSSVFGFFLFAIQWIWGIHKSEESVAPAASLTESRKIVKRANSSGGQFRKGLWLGLWDACHAWRLCGWQPVVVEQTCLHFKFKRASSFHFIHALYTKLHA